MYCFSVIYNTFLAWGKYLTSSLFLSLKKNKILRFVKLTMQNEKAQKAPIILDFKRVELHPSPIYKGKVKSGGAMVFQEEERVLQKRQRFFLYIPKIFLCLSNKTYFHLQPLYSILKISRPKELSSFQFYLDIQFSILFYIHTHTPAPNICTWAKWYPQNLNI